MPGTPPLPPSAPMIAYDASTSVGTSPVTVLDGVLKALPALHFLRIWNVAPPGSGSLWVSRSGTAVPHAPGSFPLQPLQYEQFTSPQAIPTNAVSLVASAGTIPVTVEYG